MKYLLTDKDARKLIRSIIQAIVLLVFIWILVNAIFHFNEYKHYEITQTNNNEDKGFIALSYFAVDREGTNTMISTQRLEEHFEALKKNGYMTLTQKDIENYYQKNQAIPERSMFIMFEDGRRDTAIFSSSLLERYNYIGNMLTYGEKFQDKDPKFLSDKDLKKLRKNTFWEMGTNGYRLAYINVFDRYNHYLGELSSEEYSALQQYIEREYNHYLMDFIRDEYQIPKEHYDQMKDRITKDYKLMDEVYKAQMGELPKLYVLMHSNTGQYGSNKYVSAINEELIKKYFRINFNREGFSLNNRATDIYDLTRMQPQAYWYPNHLLMRIKADTNEDIIFIEGEPKIKKDWDIVQGVAEFRKSSIIVTSEPQGSGLIRLNKNQHLQNYALHTQLTGNVLGTQTIYLRADEDLKEFIAIKLKNNKLYIEEGKEEVFVLDLNQHDRINFQSVEENKLEALKFEYKLFTKNIKRYKQPTKMEVQKKVKNEKVKTVEDGAKEFIPEIQINEAGNRKVDIYLKGNKLSVDIDNQVAVKDLFVATQNPGSIYLESAWDEYGYSQRNIADDVYDGVFEDLVIADIDHKDELIYNNKLQGKELIKERVQSRWNKIINWFIRNL